MAIPSVAIKFGNGLSRIPLGGVSGYHSQETPEVGHAVLQDPAFFRLLTRIDEELALATRFRGCRFCAGALRFSAPLSTRATVS
ncbi:hypothetical protein NB231_09073 [Nitrococcus mobilis Nb-231]|uniref:Uncharacterized protein n=1 Tax=Nitrococcus mobilis Nb-231 TaxID=314278 RepID=A4BMZ2_9GAMM|nr:hypothetical protein NB231_09073 [Nitrococcus mobilis Nb-231]